MGHDERGAKVPTLLEGDTTSFVLRGEGCNMFQTQGVFQFVVPFP